MNGSPIVLTVACAVGFRCLPGTGLIAGYVLRLRRTSAVVAPFALWARRRLRPAEAPVATVRRRHRC